MDELLKLLRKNALETPENLAEMLATTADDVRARIADYEARGVIRGYRAVVNEDQLELNRVRAVIEVKITPEREGGFNRIASRLSRFAEVESLHLMSGGFDLMVVVNSATLHEAASFVSEKLATVDGVLSTATHFMLKTYKDQGILMEQRDEDERLKVSP